MRHVRFEQAWLASHDGGRALRVRRRVVVDDDWATTFGGVVTLPCKGEDLLAALQATDVLRDALRNPETRPVALASWPEHERGRLAAALAADDTREQ